MLLPAKILRVLICLCVLAGTQVSGQEEFSGVPLEAYRKYTKAVFEHYDTDGNGVLDAEEQTKLRRLEGAADADSNGEVTFEELFGFFVSKATDAKAMASKAKEKRRRKLKAIDKLSANKVAGELNGKVKLIQNGDKLSIGGDPDDVKAVELAIGELRTSSASKAVHDNTFGLSVWIVRASDAFDVSALKDASVDSVRSQLAEMQDESVRQIESVHLNAIEGRAVEFKNARLVPVVTGVSLSRGQSSRQVENRSVGTNLELMVSRNARQITLDCDVAKSIVEDSEVSIFEGDDGAVFAPLFTELEFETTLPCKLGKASVLQTTQGGGSWVLIAVVSNE